MVQSATPTSIRIAALRHPEIRLRTPLDLSVTREGDHVVVWSELLEEVGFGPDLGAALQDFQRTVVELYLSLRASRGHLSGHLAGILSALDTACEMR